jgi:hypothetical protein
MLGAWTKLLIPAAAIEATELIAKSVSKLGKVTSSVQFALTGIFIATRKPSVPLGHLSAFLTPLKIYQPFINLLAIPDILEYDLAVNVSLDSINQLLDSSSDEAVALLTKLVEVSPDTARLTSEAISSRTEMWQDERYLGLALGLLESPYPISFGEGGEAELASLAIETIGSAQNTARKAARQILVQLPDRVATTALLVKVDLQSFSPVMIDLALDLSRLRSPELTGAVGHLLQVALQRVARICSAEGDLELEDLDLLINLGQSPQLPD